MTTQLERQQGFYDEQAGTMSRDDIAAMHWGILGSLVALLRELVDVSGEVRSFPS